MPPPTTDVESSSHLKKITSAKSAKVSGATKRAGYAKKSNPKNSKIMDYKDFIKPGVECIHIPELQEDNLWQYDPELVTIGRYRPYYRDGSPDPSPDDYNEWCYVEIEGVTKYGEAQLSLNSLRPVIPQKGEYLYNGAECTLIGTDPEGKYAVIEQNGEKRIIDAEQDLEGQRHICDLSFDELKRLRSDICVGSMYLSDYTNSCGISQEEAIQLADDYLGFIDERTELDTPEAFAQFVTAVL